MASNSNYDYNFPSLPTSRLRRSSHPFEWRDTLQGNDINQRFLFSSSVTEPYPEKMSSNVTTSGCPNSASAATSSYNFPASTSLCDQMDYMQSYKATKRNPKCGSCTQDVIAIWKCLDCKYLLCDDCVIAHGQYRHTKNHSVARLSGVSTSISSSHTSSTRTIGSPQVSPSALSINSNHYCESHRKAQQFFCQTCQIPTCRECLTVDHQGHEYMPLQDAIESGKRSNNKLNMEAKSAVMCVRQALDNVQYMLKNVELKSIQAAAEIRNAIKRYIKALEEREMQLLRIVDHSRYSRGTALTNQMDNLRLALAKLSRTYDSLNEVKESTNIYEIMAVNERAANELKQICFLKSEFICQDEDLIAFDPLDNSFLSAINTIGSVSVNASASSSIAMVPYMTELPQLFLNEIRDFGISLASRPIYGAPEEVIVQRPTQYSSFTFGQQGYDDGQLCRPWGVCCDSLGRIIVADRSNNRIQVFMANGTFLFKFGQHGIGPGDFDRPAGIAANPQDHIVVADKDNHRIQIFDKNGQFIHTFGGKGTNNGLFNYPWDVACNSFGHIVVSDTRNHRIQLFDQNGVFLNKFGFEGCTPMWKHFDSPRGVCFTPMGNIIITDFNNHRVLVVNLTESTARFLGREGTDNKEFFRPQGVVCDDKGNIIVADSKNNRIQVFSKSGEFLWKIGFHNRLISELDRPSGICLNPEGHIVVVDFGNNRVHVF